jgi:lipopolysaccharide transport system ATP-binding protein
MSDIAISVENLGKAYRIGLKEQQHETMLGAMSAWVKSPFRNFREVRNLSRFDDAKTDSASQPSSDIIWALKNVSFEVKHGEAVGIIGRNGAGKSTLLKILSRITEPTSGRAEIYGRVASLLEVGTGFHPDLTGRENVYLNATILGMKKREVDAKFEKIVDFSGVEKFIDTPVKRYSSGMRVRLAFSVAAYLEPEILIIDEVLAVGDAEFQKKCLGKMSEVAGSGRTVLFVSHNMAAVSQLCERCIALQEGKINFDGTTKEGIDAYFKTTNFGGDAAAFADDLNGELVNSKLGRIARVEITDEHGLRSNHFGIGEPFLISLHAQFHKRVPHLSMGMQFESSGGVPLLNLRTDSQRVSFGPYEAGSHVVFTVKIPGLPFYPGAYMFEPWLAELDGARFDQVCPGLTVTIDCRGRYKSEQFIQHGRGIVMMDCDWRAERQS